MPRRSRQSLCRAHQVRASHRSAHRTFEFVAQHIGGGDVGRHVSVIAFAAAKRAVEGIEHDRGAGSARKDLCCDIEFEGLDLLGQIEPCRQQKERLIFVILELVLTEQRFCRPSSINSSARARRCSGVVVMIR